MEDLTGIRLFCFLFGGFSTVLGLAAWTGRYRTWARMGRGYRVLAMLPGGIMLLALGGASLEPPVVVARILFVVAILSALAAFGMLLLTIFLKDRWYPRWYHQVPDRQW